MIAFTAHLLESVEPAVHARGELSGREPPEQLALDTLREQDQAMLAAAERLAREQGAAIVLFGHTHRSVDQRLSGGARYLNTGTWTWLLDLQNAGPAAWRDLFAHPGNYANRRRLNYARIDYDDASAPSAQLLECEPAGVTGGKPFAQLVTQVLALLRRWLRHP